MSQEEANSFRNEEPHLPTPPSGEWDMNVFLNELADELTADDLKKMKYLLSGFNGTRKGVLEHINDPLDLFQHLRQRCILTRDNIVYLQAMLWHTRRKDLHNKLVKYARKRGNLIHFYAPNEKPENGYEYIKFHIGGKEKMDRHKLEELRMHVSHALCVPAEFIIVSGIEATNSIMVTFMVPEGYANVAFDLTDKEKEYLGSKGVDAIWYNGRIINCIDVEPTAEDESIQKDEEIKILLDQKSKLDQEVESLQIQVLKLDRDLRHCKKNEEVVQQEAEKKIAEVTCALIQQYIDMKYTPKAMSLQDITLRNAIRWCNHTLKKMEELGYDTNLIKSLLEANTIVTRSRMKSCQAWIETQQQQQISKLIQVIHVLLYQRDKLAYFMKTGISEPILTENEEFFLHVIASTIPIPVQTTETTEVSMTFGKIEMNMEVLKNVLTGIFKTFEDTLNEKEKKMLIQKFLPTRDDKKAWKESNLLLLEYLWFRYATENGLENANFHEWMIRVLAGIRRVDLADMWSKKSDMLIKAFKGESNEDTEEEDDVIESDRTESQVPRRTARRFGHSGKAKRGKSGKQQSAVEGVPNRSSMEAISERLQRIEEKVDRNVKLTERFTIPSTWEQRSFYEKSDDTSYDWTKLLKTKYT